MKKIGFLGCGKIGQAMIHHVEHETSGKVVFAVDKADITLEEDVVCKKELTEEDLSQVELLVECANADVLKIYGEKILKHCSLLVFSVTAFSDKEFADKCEKLCTENGTHIYFPHGAILGLDGISDAKPLLKKASIYTVKPPKSFGRTDTERTVLFEGSTREACKAYPRNVNVHAAVALAGIGFDETRSYIVSDPSYTENCHDIQIEGEGIKFRLEVKSFATGGVTGAYTPVSACGSLDRLMEEKGIKQFV